MPLVASDRGERNEDDRIAYLKVGGIDDKNLKAFTGGRHWSTWWPPKEGKSEMHSIRFEEGDDDAEAPS